MKLIIMIVQDSDALKLIDALIDDGIGVTKMSTTGGFLRRGNTTLMVGIEDAQTDNTLKIIENCCKKRTKMIMPTSAIGEPYLLGAPIEVAVGGATCFIIDCEQKKF